MPTLEIAVDARGVEQGLRQANKALDETAQKADRAEREVKQMGQASHQAGRDMGAAFAATGGGLAITHGLEGISSGFRSGNSAMAAFAASQALLDLGRFAEDMKSVSAATGSATTVFGTLGTIIKAHPLMTIATVLAGAAAAMAIFTSDTEEAANEFERLGQAMEKVRLGRGAAELLGLSQLTQAQRAQQGVQDVATQFMAGPMTYGQMATALGIGPVRNLLALQQAGGAGLPAPEFRQVGGGGRLGAITEAQVPIAEQRVTREAAQAILRTLYKQLQTEAEELKARGPAAIGAAAAGQPFSIFDVGQAGAPFTRGGVLYPQGFGTGQALMRQPGAPGTFGYQPPSGPGLSGGMGMVGYGINMGMQTLTQMQAFANEQALEAENRMRELVSLGETFGQTIGDAFFRVAEGTMTARQAMAELVRQFAQMAAQSAFRGIGGQLFGSFAPTQTQTNANFDPGPLPPNA